MHHRSVSTNIDNHNPDPRDRRIPANVLQGWRVASSFPICIHPAMGQDNRLCYDLAYPSAQVRKFEPAPLPKAARRRAIDLGDPAVGLQATVWADEAGKGHKLRPGPYNCPLCGQQYKRIY
ncbi:hypothetical protein PM082_021901, partial [Marasmius tenuissimus]